jgi:putative RecB family exonuclease
MRERPLSASSVKTFLQCALKYYFQYEDKKPGVAGGEHLAFGTALHAALEEMHRIVSETGKPPTQETYDHVINVFMNSAVKDKMKSQSLYAEGKDILMPRLDGVDPTEKILGLELGFELKTPAGTPFKGSIDKLIELDPTTAVIIDYKSSRMALTQEEADEDIQLSMYDLAVSMMFPQYTNIICAFDYLRLGEVVTHRSPEQRALFVKFLDNVYGEICAMQKEDVKPTLNTFCGWCDFKSYCPSYEKMVSDPDMILPRIDDMDDNEFVEAWIAFEAAKKIVESRGREFKDEAYTRLKNSETIKGSDVELFKIQTGRKNYDSRSVFNIVGTEEFVKMASINKSGLDKYLRDHPDDVDIIEDRAAFSFQNPTFRTRKVRND